MDWFTTYQIMNANNIYNFLIDILNKADSSTRIEILKSIKIQIGLTFYNNFRMYIFKKIPDSSLLALFYP